MVRSSFATCVTLLLGVAPLARAGFVRTVKDTSGVWWLEHDGRRFLQLAVNHVNDGGLDDGVGGRESVECRSATGSA
jgi:hypothetical protein